MFYIYLYIFICLLIFWNDSGNFENLLPLFWAVSGSFSEDFYVYTVYTRYFFDPKHFQIMFNTFNTSNTIIVCHI